MITSSVNCSMLVILLFYALNVTLGEPIRGITIRNWPYANRLENGQFEGLVVDLLNEISRIAKITYTLELSDETEYGGWTKNGSATGLIGKVYRKEYDFAIGDITRLTTRDRFVQFSYPFMRFGLTALIRKDNVGNMTSFQDLAEQSEVAYGVKKRGANLPLVHENPVIIKMYNYMDANPSTAVKDEKEGVERVKSGDQRYAFITEGPFNEYTMNRDCDLTVIDDNQTHFQFEYGIAMRKDLIQRRDINAALRQMKREGTLDLLKDKYWKTNKCTDDSDANETDPNVAAAPLVKDPSDKEKWNNGHWPPQGNPRGHRKPRGHGHERRKGSATMSSLSLMPVLISITIFCLLS